MSVWLEIAALVPGLAMNNPSLRYFKTRLICQTCGCLIEFGYPAQYSSNDVLFSEIEGERDVLFYEKDIWEMWCACGGRTKAYQVKRVPE